MDEGKRFREAMETTEPSPPRQGAIRIQAMTACDCGCGAPERVEITVMGYKPLSMIDPCMVDKMIDCLTTAREELWGPR